MLGGQILLSVHFSAPILSLCGIPEGTPFTRLLGVAIASAGGLGPYRVQVSEVLDFHFQMGVRCGFLGEQQSCPLSLPTRLNSSLCG